MSKQESKPGPGTIGLWRDNRLDAYWVADIGELAGKFWASTQGKSLLEYGGRLERSLRSWVTDPAGLSSAWDDERKFGELWDAVRAAWPDTSEQG
jgi:hypothetical protein